MSEIRITFCDHCNEDQHVNGRGTVHDSQENCVEHLGWKETEYGIMCRDCQREEEDANWAKSQAENAGR